MAVDWQQFPGPEHYDPAEVPRALAALLAVTDERSGTEAYNRVLFAIGNNHAGTLYPAAAAAAPEIVRIFTGSRGPVRSAALDILVELAGCFEPEPGFASFRREDGLTVDLKAEVVKAVQQGEEAIYRVLESPDEREVDRVNALDILWAIATDPDRLVSSVRDVLARQPGKILGKQCASVLADPRGEIP